jgi:hypothetical protein
MELDDEAALAAGLREKAAEFKQGGAEHIPFSASVMASIAARPVTRDSPPDSISTPRFFCGAAAGRLSRGGAILRVAFRLSFTGLAHHHEAQ